MRVEGSLPFCIALRYFLPAPRSSSAANYSNRHLAAMDFQNRVGSKTGGGGIASVCPAAFSLCLLPEPRRARLTLCWAVSRDGPGAKGAAAPAGAGDH